MGDAFDSSVSVNVSYQAATIFSRPSHCGGRVLSSAFPCQPAAMKGEKNVSPCCSSDWRLLSTQQRAWLEPLHCHHPCGDL